MSDITPITREEALLDGQDLTPITRKEQFIKRIYDPTQVIPEPATREEWFLKKAGEGSSPITIEALSVTENGTYSEAGKAYSPVTVEVPLPTNANERKSVTSYPVTDSANYPLPKCDVTVTDADKCEVIVTTDNTITEDSGVYIERQSGGGNRELDAIVGGSVVWNQLVQETDTSCTVQSGHKYVLKQGSTYTVVVSDGTAFTVDGSVNDNVYDLTAVFGSTIADYIYSLEQSTAGSGIAWLKSYGYLTEDYYGYTANKIESVSVARHVMKDSNDSVIGRYAINPITLRGIPRLNASNQLYYDGDRYEASGRVTRKYGIVVLDGTQPLALTNWRASESGVGWIYPYSLTNNIFPLIDNPPNLLCDKYSARSYNELYRQNVGVGEFNTDSYGIVVWINEPTLTTEALINTWLASHPITIVYELATPTTESTSPFEANQIVDANGTEEYIDAGVDAGTRDVAIPVGHETKYFNGKAYVKPLTAGTSDTVSMADMGIMPTSPMYISANGSVDVEYWKSNS